MIRFTNVTYKNFLGSGDIETTIGLDDSRTTILIGKSGAGKSTLLDAISFALYNKPFRNINKKFLVNSVNGKDCSVTITFQIGSKTYKVVRGIKPNVFEIWENGGLINQEAAVKDYQLFLEKNILQINHKAFVQIVVLGASNFTPFMQLTPSDRRLIIEELLDIQIFSAMSQLHKVKMSTTKTEISHVERQIELLQEKIHYQKKHIETLSNGHKQKIEEKNKQIEEQKKSIENKKEEIKQREVSIKETQEGFDKIHQLKEELAKAVLAIQDVDDEIVKCDKILRETSKIEGQLEIQRKGHKKHLDFYEKNHTCPTCTQEIELNFKTKIIEENLSSLADLEAQEKILQEKKKEFENKKTELSESQKKKKTITTEINNTEKKLLMMEKDVEKQNSFVDRLKEEIEYITNQIAKIKEEIKELNVEPETGEEVEKLKKYESQLDEFEKQKKELYIQKEVQENAALVLKDTGVKSRIISEYIPIINKSVNHFLQSMSFSITFMLDENFDELIRTRGRDAFKYENFSEGERQRLDLAILFTWRLVAKGKNSINTNLLVMDEVVDSYLDTAATENVLSIFNTELFAGTNIFVISHKESITDLFDRTIKFQKIQGFSRVVE